MFSCVAGVSWHGSRAGHREWGSGCNLLACVFDGEGTDVYGALNCGGGHREVGFTTHGWKVGLRAKALDVYVVVGMCVACRGL